MWTDGTPAAFDSFPGAVAPWNPGEPNGHAGEATDGAYVYPSINHWVVPGSWDDDDIAKPRAFVCTLPPPPPPPPLAPHVTDFGPFRVYELEKNYTDADAYCTATLGVGSHLASIRDLDENEQVHSLAVNVGSCWIGYSDLDEDDANEFEWADGLPANFSRWPNGVAPWNPGAPGRHANGTVVGAFMYLPQRSGEMVRAGTWDVASVEEARCFICRQEAPRPAGLSADGGGGAAGTVVLVLFLLILTGGCGFWVYRRRKASLPLVPNAISSRFAQRARTTHVAGEGPRSQLAPEYTPPLASPLGLPAPMGNQA